MIEAQDEIRGAAVRKISVWSTWSRVLTWLKYRQLATLVLIGGMPWGLSLPGILMCLTARIPDALAWFRARRVQLSRVQPRRARPNRTGEPQSPEHEVFTHGSDKSTDSGPIQALFRTASKLVTDRHPIVAAMNLLAVWMLFTSLTALKIVPALGASLAAILVGFICFTVAVPAILEDERMGKLSLVVFVLSAAMGASYLCVDHLVNSPPDWVRPRLAHLNVNRLGNVMATAVLCSLALTSILPKLWKLLPFLVMLIQVAALVLTKTRSAWVGLAAGLLVSILALRSYKLLVVALILFLAFAVIVSSLPGALSRLQSIVSLERNQDRIDLWKTALRAIAESPLIGFGMDNFGTVYDRLNPERSDKHGLPAFTHNVFLEFAVATGTPGLLLVAVVLLGTLALAVKYLIIRPAVEEPSIKRPGIEPGPRPLAFVLAIYVLQLVHMQFDLIQASPITMPLLYIPLGILIRYFETKPSIAFNTSELTCRDGSP